MTILQDHYDQELGNPEQVTTLLRDWLNSLDEIARDKEHLFVIYLGASSSIRAIDVVSIGTSEATIAHPREVFRRAISLGAVEVVLAHNHTGRRSEPSTEDLRLTRSLKKAGQIIGISVVDSIIFTDNDYFSFSQEELI